MMFVITDHFFLACLLANRAYEDPESHRLRRQGGDVLEPREYGLPNMGVSGRFLQPLCSSVVLGPAIPLIMHARGPRCGSKAANLSSTLIISCTGSAQRNFPLLSRRTCGEDLADVGGTSSMRLRACSLLLPRRRLRSDGRWSLGQEQQAPSAASWVTKKPYLGSTLLISTRGGRESLLVQTLNNFIQIKAKALGHRKNNLLNRLSRRAPLESFINSYRGLKLMAELLRI